MVRVALPLIVQDDQTLGFHWSLPDGTPATLAEVIGLPEAEANRWLPTHLEALDDVLIAVAARFADVMGGGRDLTADERDEARAAFRTVDRLSAEYASAWRASGLRTDLRAGQIIGTGVLMSIRLRVALGEMGPAPFDGDLDQPGPGVVGGHAGMHEVDAAMPWLGSRWLVVTDEGRRLPATLSMLLHDSSGVDKDATLKEHRASLRAVTGAVDRVGVEPIEASGAVDWLLYDWLMAHRDGEDSGAVELRRGQERDAAMIVDAAAASVTLRAAFP